MHIAQCVKYSEFQMYLIVHSSFIYTSIYAWHVMYCCMRIYMFIQMDSQWAPLLKLVTIAISKILYAMYVCECWNGWMSVHEITYYIEDIVGNSVNWIWNNSIYCTKLNGIHGHWVYSGNDMVCDEILCLWMHVMLSGSLLPNTEKINSLCI